MNAQQKLKKQLLAPYENQIDEFLNEISNPARVDPSSHLIKCFECGNGADHWHHVIPRIHGGTQTIPLCTTCHAKVHGIDRVTSSQLIKLGIEKARANGARWGRPLKHRASANVNQIVSLKAKGYSIRKISLIVNVSSSTVHRIINNSESIQTANKDTSQA